MRNTLLLSLTSLIFLVFYSCKTEYSTTELNANFTAEQISDLTEIREFFINQVCESDFKSCYKETNHDSLQALGIGLWNKINFGEQKTLYDRIAKSTFKEIWIICKSVNHKTDEEKKSICANAIGKYQKYLSDIGKQNPMIAKYAERINAYGDFPSLEFQPYNILNNPKNFNLDDPNIQLILAIHYLSLNDQDKRNENWVAE